MLAGARVDGPRPGRVATRRAATAVAAAAIVIGAGLALAGCSTHPTGALSKLAHLDEGTLLASGQVPPVVPGVDVDLVPTSLRLLTTYDGAEFWVGVTRADEVCFVAQPVGTSGGTAPGSAVPGGAVSGSAVSGSSVSGSAAQTGFTPTASDGTEAVCLEADSFGRHGAMLELPSGERAWLHTEYMTVSPGWTEVSANIAVRG